MIRRALSYIVFIISIYCSFSSSTATGEETVKTCANVVVRSIKVLSVRPEDMGSSPATPKITSTPGKEPGEVTLLITGPILGEMDSHAITTELSCTAYGIGVVATITRDANYNEQGYVDAYDNHMSLRPPFFWEPCVELELAVHQPPPDVDIEANWIMSLSNGTILDHARTYMFPEQSYPVTLSTTIHAANLKTP